MIDDDERLNPEDQLAAFLGEDEFGEAFIRAEEELPRSGVRERLQAVGLVGNQLRVKLGAWRRAVTRSWRQPSLGFARIATGWADAVLGSLAVAVPVVDLIKEFKEVIERAVDDKEADPGPFGGA